MLGYVKSFYESLMGIGTIFHGVLAVANLCVGNVPGAFTEGVAAVKSYAIGGLLSPLTEPVKEIAGDAIGSVDWGEVADVCQFW